MNCIAATLQGRGLLSNEGGAMSGAAVEHAEHVTREACNRRCRTTQWIVGTILAGIAAALAGVAIMWGSVAGAAGECTEATTMVREHQAASVERREAVEQRLDRMDEGNQRSFSRIEERLDDIVQRLP